MRITRTAGDQSAGLTRDGARSGAPGSPAGRLPGPSRAGRLRGSRGLPGLYAASLLLALAGAGLVVAGAQVRGSPAAANRAVTDAAATRQVIGAVTADATRIFSYSYTDLPATQRAARRVLAGSAAAQYGKLFPQLRDAVSERLTVVTRVVRAGVTQLSGGRAQLLIFIDQTATRGQAKASTTPDQAQLAIAARLRAGQWWITSIEAR